MRVIVIGAGLGGLCLAHGLRKAGIDVQVSERQVRIILARMHSDPKFHVFNQIS